MLGCVGEYVCGGGGGYFRETCLMLERILTCVTSQSLVLYFPVPGKTKET